MIVKVGIVDYAISNLASVANALRRIGAEPVLVRSAIELEAITHLVLPGVGNFAKGIENLRSAGLIEPLREWAASGRPLLGLCLGMQLLAEEGEEYGPNAGLGLIPGKVVKMTLGQPELRLPHIGWNEVEIRGESRLARGLDASPIFYFIHSYCYHDAAADYVSGVCEYDGRQVAMVEQGNIFGVQFHPEKSQKSGLKLLANFVAIQTDA